MMPLDACRSSMVSNSGTMLMALRPEGWTRPASFSSTATSSMSDMPLHIEMMHWGITSLPNLACASAAAWNTREFARGLLAVFHEGRGQRPRVAQFAGEQRDPRLLVQRQIGHAGHRRVDQFGDRALVHGGILPDIEAGEVEAETIHRAAQQPQPPARDHARIVRDQRAIENIEIGLELPDIGVRSGFADRPPGNADIQLQRGRGEPRVNAGYREAIGLAAAMRRLVGRAFGELCANPWRRRRDAPPSTVRSRARAVPRDRSAAPGSTAARAFRASRRRSRTGCRRGRRRSSFPSAGKTPVRPARPSPSFSRSSSAQCSRGTSCRKV